MEYQRSVERVWYSWGWLALSDEMETATLRKADEGSFVGGMWIESDADEWHGCPYASSHVSSLITHLQGRKAVKVGKNRQGINLYQLEDGTIVPEMGHDTTPVEA